MPRTDTLRTELRARVGTLRGALRPAAGPGARSWRSAARLTVAGAVALAAVWSLFLTGDGMLRAHFDIAFDAAIPATAAPSANRNFVQPVAANEDYWLGDARNSPAIPASWNAQPRVSVGERITLSLRGGQRVLQVVSVKAMPAAGLPSAGLNPAQGPLVLVTLLPVSDPLAGSHLNGGSRPIHVLLQADDDLADVAVHAPAHEL